MPIYEYRCNDCGHELEALQKIADAPLTDCPECDQSSLKKLISAVGFRLAGSGWYETDFKTGEKKKNLAGDAKEKSDGTKTADKSDSKASDKSIKSDAKPAKSESKPASKASSSDSAS